MDRLLYPQYEQGGRFNLLSLLQLPYAFTKQGTQEIGRRKGLQERAQTAGVEQSEANVKGTRAETGLTEARTGGVTAGTTTQELTNQNMRFAQRRASEQAAREDAARLALPPSNGVPGELRPEFSALMSPLQEQERSAALFRQQQELADLGLGETRGLVASGQPITQAGQFAAGTAASSAESKAKLDAEQKRANQAAAAQLLSHAMTTLNPEMVQFAVETARKLGVDVAQFPMAQPNNPAAEIDAEVQKRKSAAAGPPPPSSSPVQSAPSPHPLIPSPQPSPVRAQNSRGGVWGIGRTPTDREQLFNRLQQIVGEGAPGLAPGGIRALAGPAERWSGASEFQNLNHLMEQVAGGAQYSGIFGDIPSDRFPMRSVQEVLEIIRQLQAQGVQ